MCKQMHITWFLYVTDLIIKKNFAILVSNLKKGYGKLKYNF